MGGANPSMNLLFSITELMAVGSKYTTSLFEWDNIWVIAEAYGSVVQFELYQGAKKGKQVTSFVRRWTKVERKYIQEQ